MNNEILKKTKMKKLVEAHTNNIEISNMNLKDKYTNFEQSKLQESKTLLYEIKEKPKYFKRYSRGRIVKVSFGVNIGSEFSGDHFAIVVSKNDTAYNPVLHVIPITSKFHKNYLNIGSALINEEYIKELNDLYNSTEISDKDKKKITTCLKYYKSRDNYISYAAIEHMKTVSKLSIMKPINEYDYITKLKLSNDLLEELNEEIIKEFTISKLK